MSINLKENQLIAAELLSVGISSTAVSETLGIRPETLSRWRQNQEFNEQIELRVTKYCSLIDKQFLKSNLVDSILKCQTPWGQTFPNTAAKCRNSTK